MRPSSHSFVFRCRVAAAFSLIEVMAAVAIFGVGMLGVLALMTPVTQSVTGASEADAAARVADAVRARVQALVARDGFDATVERLVKRPAAVRANDNNARYNPNDGAANPSVIFGSRNGEAAFYDGNATPKAWYDYTYAGTPRAKAMSDVDKFFEVDLIRNEALSPVDPATPPAMVAYTMRVRWPAFIRTSPTTAVQSAQSTTGGNVPFDHSRKQVLFFNGAITR